MVAIRDRVKSAEGTAQRERAQGLPRWRDERIALTGIVLLYVLLSVLYARIVPWGEVPDEPAHERYVEYVVRYGKLPLITGVHPYTNESQQPPLYYALGAVVVWGTRLVTGAPLNAPLNANVAPNPDLQKPSGEYIYSVLAHNVANRFPPYAFLLRGLSIVLGIITVLFTYAAARRFVPPPAPPAVALAAAACMALIPERLFISAAVTNENLSALMGAWLCFLIAGQLSRPTRGAGSKSWSGLHLPGSTPAWMGLVLGLGVLSKFTVGAFLPVLLWVLWVSSGGRLRAFARDAALMCAVTALVAGPLLVYNTVQYGDPVASRSVAEMLPNDSTFHLGDLFWFKDPFARMLWTSFWGVFGWQRLWMTEVFYDMFAVLTWAGLIGGGRLLWQRALSGAQKQFCAAMLGVGIIVYAVAVLYSLRVIAWQGRELYPGLASICILLGTGAVGLVMGKRATESADNARVQGVPALLAPLAVIALLLLANVYALITINDVFAPTWH